MPMPILPRSLWRALWWPAFWMAGGCHLPVLLTMTCEVSTAATGRVHAAALAYRHWAARMLQLQTDRSKSACVVAATARTKSKSWPSQLG